MRRVTELIRRYPFVAATVLVGLLGAGLWIAGLPEPIRWLFSAFALFVAAWHAVQMVRAMLRREFGLDVLAVTAIVATVVVGEYVAALIVVLMLTGGEALEDAANRRARGELNALLDRSPRIAHRRDADGIRDVPAGELRIGDVIVVQPAEVVPVDGVVLSAAAEVDASSVTGESLPVALAAGATVLSGSVNGAAAMELTATATAADSQYARIVALVREASESRAPVVRLADRFAVPFTLLSLAIAGVAWAVSGQPGRFAEVLVLATPCPLLIAAPVAFIGGMSRAARRGILVKGGGVLELLARARTAVFDKTGTLTLGRPEVAAVRPAAGFTEPELLAAAASAEQYSAHTLADSLQRAAEERGVVPVLADSATEHTAQGVTARVGGRDVVVGKFSFVAEHAQDAARTPLEPGELAVYVAVDGRFAGAIVAADEVREDAPDTLRRLAELGVGDVLMLTGDAEPTARHVAAELGIERFRAECLPADKVAAVAAVTERPVIMVGDGVNDSPVLAAADVGIAMGARGATAASESAAAVILVDRFGRVADAVAIGRETVRIALQSIWAGILISVGLMLVAAFGLIPATIGALLQEVVDVVTIVAALRAIGRRRAF
ncbi:MAG: cadmium-translocating P-type ATPase [Microbacteriaceae bacterium]|nr:cadmium-translocating P-type ATPase [Microbacteriaceae bacterium]